MAMITKEVRRTPEQPNQNIVDEEFYENRGLNDFIYVRRWHVLFTIFVAILWGAATLHFVFYLLGR